MVAAETSASPITVASRKLHSPTSRASTKQRLNWLRRSNSCATRFALAASADERRVEFFSMDHPEQVRLCLRVRLPARQAFRFCPSPDRVSRKNLLGWVRRACGGFLLALGNFHPALFSLTRSMRWADSAAAPTIQDLPIRTRHLISC